MVVLDFVDLPEDGPEREGVYSEHLYCPSTTTCPSRSWSAATFSFNSPFGACPDCSGASARAWRSTLS
ncbi:excinuclease ABC subunit UvrA [Streptomyces violaceorubidus]